LRVVLDNPLLRALAGGSGTFNFFGNFIGTLYGLYITRELGAAPIFVRFLLAAGGIGALVGAFIAERVVQRFGLGVTIGGALLISGVTGFLIPLARGSVIQAVSFLFVSQLVGDVAIAVYLITEVSLRQAIIPGSMLGRANASMQFLTQGLGPIGALIAGVLGGFIGLRPTLLIGVLGIVLASFWLLFSPLRKVKSLENDFTLTGKR